MKKSLMTLGVLALFVLMAYGQEKKFALYSVAFYNMENLFDTIHDEGKNDYEYLPNGTNQWNTMKYKAKLKNMSEILSLLSTDKLPMGPAIIGVSEIENYRVLEERGFLIASGNIAGEKMHFIVNHWPSRAAASPARERAGEQVRAIKDSLLREDSAAKIVIMGDMNDDPMDKSMAVALGAKRKPADVGPTDLYNPWWDTLKKGYGTLMYKGKWNLFDQIVFTGNLLGTDRSTLKFYKHEIFRRDFMFQKEGKYKGYPKRTQAGGVWLNGYSDHLPTIIYLIKEVK